MVRALSRSALDGGKPALASATDNASQVAEQQLLNLLSRGASFDASSLDGWWAAERCEREGLAAFLERQGILVAGAAKTLALAQKGYVQIDDPATLFSSTGLQHLLDRLNPSANAPRVDMTKTAVMSEARPTAHHFSAATETPVPAEHPVAGAPLEIGAQLGKCLLTELLGQGGNGVVYRALHRGLNIPVAVKLLNHSALASDPQGHEKLRAEARLLAQLAHPHVIRVLDFEDDPKQPYLVLEYVEGLSLAELIRQSGSLRLYRAAKIIAQVADGLAAAHKLGIVHRDIKPANILLGKEGQAKLADLGLAVASHNRTLAQCLGVAAAAPDLAGTVAYMAPELFSDTTALDHRSDVYALGVTFYHAVTGRVPFAGATPTEVMLRHVEEQAVAPHELVPDLGVAASEAILRMMAKRPEDRPQSYEEVRAALVRLAVPPETLTDQSGAAGSTRSDGPSNQFRSSRWRSFFSLFAK
ncbi:MAG: serine/threonine protein kinase [Gemmataceae bacterium]|nr:serine/threonine protein kinase [Gemmataceae bacterium]